MRMWQLLQCFQEKGWEVCFSCTGEQTRFSADLDDLGIVQKKILLNDDSFDSWVAEWCPDIVLFDRFMLEEQFGWRVARICPKALRILDTEDLHSLRMAREEALGLQNFSTDLWLNHTHTLRELASIYRSDLSLIISTYEMELLTNTAGIPESLLCYLPFMLDPIIENDLPSFEQRSGFISIGNGRHRPNIDAFLHLYQELWPGIREKLPQARISVFGAYFPKDIIDLNTPSNGFHVMGWADSIQEELLKSRVQLTPLRYGAGIKGKLADSMQSGTPSVTTPVGAEGMHGQWPWGGIVAINDDQFIKAAVQLHEDQELWLKASRMGCHLVNAIYNRKENEARLLNQIEWLRGDLENHRRKNLVGAMMRHHRMASTMYMSKWIASKKKLLQEGKPAD